MTHVVCEQKINLKVVYSDNCKRELFTAIQSSKSIIPLLVPDLENESTSPAKGLAAKSNSAGWTGPSDNPSWWHHAQQCCKEPYDPDSKERIDFQALGQFDPIDMTGERQMEPGSKAVDMLLRRITSRFHRFGSCCFCYCKIFSAFGWPQQ
jgi:hypothetical protein